MKKRVLTVFLTLLIVISVTTFFIACSDNNDTPPPSSCEHVGDGSGYCTLCDDIVGTTDGVIYGLSLDETYAEVTGYEGSSNRVIISGEYQSKPVKKICESAFKYSTLTSVVIPSGVTDIGNDAFANCNNLMKVNFLGTIDQWAQISFSNSYAHPLNLAKNLYINNELNIIDTENFDATIEEYMGEDAKNLYNEHIEELESIRRHEERKADEYYQMLNHTMNEVRELKRYLKDAKRMNREKLIEMVLELEDTLNNY